MNATSSMHTIAWPQLLGSAYKPSSSCTAQNGNKSAMGDGEHPVTLSAGSHVLVSFEKAKPGSHTCGGGVVVVELQV